VPYTSVNDPEKLRRLMLEAKTTVPAGDVLLSGGVRHWMDSAPHESLQTEMSRGACVPPIRALWDTLDRSGVTALVVGHERVPDPTSDDPNSECGL